MSDKKILLISDMVGKGSVALSAMIPVMANLKADCSYLPTALVSNNFGYGDVVLYELTDFMEQTIEVWKKLEFEFDMIVTGIVLNMKQVQLIDSLIQNQLHKPIVISDPIMGDNGQFYDGLSDDLYQTYIELVKHASVLTPNITELSKILKKDYVEVMKHEQVCEWLNELKTMGTASIALTSVCTDEGYFVYVYEDFGEIQRIAYERMPYDFGGTGDIFTSIIAGCLARDKNLMDSATTAVSILSKIIAEEATQNHKDMKIIQVEQYLELISSECDKD